MVLALSPSSLEAFENLVALPAAVLLAGAELGRQTEILGLLLRADANVDHRADHLGSLAPFPAAGKIRRRGMARSVECDRPATPGRSQCAIASAWRAIDRAPRRPSSASASSPSNSRHRAIGDRFRTCFRTFGTSMALPHDGDREIRVGLGGALRRVDVAVDAPMSVERGCGP